MEGCRETNIMWERHNDSDIEIMKKRGEGGTQQE